MKPKSYLLFCAVSLLAVLSSCGKSVTVETQLTIMPRVQNISGGPMHDGFMLTVYAFYVPEGSSKPMSWAMAEAGIVQNISSGELIGHDVAAEQDSDHYIRMRLIRSNVLLVATDPINEIYAWREITLPEDFPRLDIVLRFLLWKTTAPYVDSSWTVVDESKLQ